MLPGNGGIPFRTTGVGFCSDSSEVIFTIPLLAPVSHHHRLALPFCGKVRQCIFDTPLLYISFFYVVKPDVEISQYRSVDKIVMLSYFYLETFMFKVLILCDF